MLISGDRGMEGIEAQEKKTMDNQGLGAEVPYYAYTKELSVAGRIDGMSKFQ